ncbi:MAG: LapA family protein [Gammaproteobacteria bacterium]|nr:LapA family protein [Gammaproteobacteria bacterium]
MSRLLKLCLVLGIMLIGLAFHLRNDQFITLDYYAGGIEFPFSLWLFLALSTGAFLGVIACLPMTLRWRRENHRLARQLKLYETELNSLRTGPIRDASAWTPAG